MMEENKGTYKIYAGLGGGFGGAKYIETIENISEEEASYIAWEYAVQEYESYDGLHGLQSWSDCIEEAEGYFGEINDDNQSEFDDLVKEIYNEAMESWLHYYVEKVENE